MLTIESLYESHERELRRFCQKLTGSRESAEDLVHEAFIRGMAHGTLLETLEPRQRRAWLFQVVRNLAFDATGQARLREQLLAAREERPEGMEPDQPAHVLLGECLAKVNPQDGALLVRHFLSGESSEEIARDLGIPAGTVRYRIHTALRRIRGAAEKTS